MVVVVIVVVLVVVIVVAAALLLLLPHYPHARSTELTDQQPERGGRVADLLDHSGMGSSGTSSIMKHKVTSPTRSHPTTDHLERSSP